MKLLVRTAFVILGVLLVASLWANYLLYQESNGNYIFPSDAVPLERQLVWSDDVAAAVTDVNAFLATLAGEQVIVMDTAPILAGENGTIQEKFSRDTLHLNGEGYAALNAALVNTLTE